MGPLVPKASALAVGAQPPMLVQGKAYGSWDKSPVVIGPCCWRSKHGVTGSVAEAI